MADPITIHVAMDSPEAKAIAAEQFAIRYTVDGQAFMFRVPDFDQADAYEYIVNPRHGEPIARAFAAAGMPTEYGKSTTTHRRLDDDGALVVELCDRITIWSGKG